LTNAEPRDTSETTTNRFLAIAAAVAVLLIGGAVVVFAGGDGDEDPTTVLEQIFNNDERVTSGVLDLSLEVSAEGEQGGSLSASLGGPFQGDADDANALPQLDLTASLSGEGFGDQIPAFEGGLTVSEDNAFVTYQAQAYEVGEETFTQVKDQLEAQAAAVGDPDESATDLGAFFERFDVDPATWLTELKNEGTEDIEGESAIHIHGEADLSQILSDLVTIGSQVPGAEAQGLPSAETLDLALSQIEQVVSEASLDVYGAEDDGTLRGIDLNLALTPPEGVPVPVDSVDVHFSLRLSEVNEEQTIEAPTDARPIEDLLGQLGVDTGQLDDLGALGGGGLGGGLDLGGAGGGGGTGSGGGVPDFDEYQTCIEEAGDDTAALLECGELLQ
jgi:hypothetical protein